jgi:hypothetical protein
MIVGLLYKALQVLHCVMYVMKSDAQIMLICIHQASLLLWYCMACVINSVAEINVQ